MFINIEGMRLRAKTNGHQCAQLGVALDHSEPLRGIYEGFKTELDRNTRRSHHRIIRQRQISPRGYLPDLPYQ